MEIKSFEILVYTIRSLAKERQLPKKLANKELLPSTLLDDLGMDSLGQLNLISELEERIDTTFPESGLGGMETLEDLAKEITRLMGSKE